MYTQKVGKMAGVIPAGYKQLSQQIFKTVNVTKSIHTGDNGARVCKEYAFKGDHPLLKHGIGYIRTTIDQGKKGISYMEAFDIKGHFLTQKVKDLIALVKDGYGIKVEGMSEYSLKRDIWKHQ
ncbi:MAG: hypothetical protein IKU37_04115 [Candidatus Gastranaerophilales bacterium]|nr:hypothetical protein [Candidatus Gastranaerophilales bacterium]